MKKLKWLFSTLLLFSQPLLHAQFMDDFSDGNFTENPRWEGDSSKFIVNNQKQLQLEGGNTSGVAYLSSQNTLNNGDIEWRVSVKMSFAPSDNNYACFYLCASESNLKSDSLQGYFLKFGESGSADVIELFYQENGRSYSVFRGITSIAAAFSYNIKVTKDPTNFWRLYVDEFQTGIYREENAAYGYCNISDYQYIGIKCQYTSTNSNRFYFDDFYCGPPLIDTAAPTLQHVEAVSDGIVTLTFSRAMDSSLIYLPNYSLQNNLSPIACEWDVSSPQQVVLHFDAAFEERVTYELTMQNLKAWNGAPLRDTTANFMCYHIFRNDVVISEFMASPHPIVQLPECEYVEIFNRLPFEVVLSNWSLVVGTSNKTLPNIVLPARSAACIVPAAYREYFPPDENYVTVSSLLIADEEQTLSLCNEKGEVMFHLTANRKWHTSDLKAAGGWSLEMIDVDNPCGGKENWASSVSSRGGTPAAPNSVSAEEKDVASPHLEKVVVIDSKHVKVFFNEPLSDVVDTTNLSLFSIDRNVEIQSIRPVSPNFNALLITLSTALEYNIYYKLTLNGLLCDCVGNAADIGQFMEFALPQAPAENDIVINEVLFNSFESTDAPYLELYNRSNKVFDLADLYVGVGNGDLPKSAIPILESGWQLFPHQYVAICKDKSITKSQYYIENERFLIENPKYPTLSNSGGTIHLLNKEYEHVDKFTYAESMHYSLLQSVDGVSLERMHFDAPTQDNSNWKSAAESAGWGTPGYQNSQFSELAVTDDALQITPELFSPDNDGIDDYAEIYCRFEDPENRVTATVYNRQGQKIKVLANNQFCGYEERYIWDGTADNGSAQGNNIYVVKVDWWNMNGKHRSLKKCVSLVRRRL